MTTGETRKIDVTIKPSNAKDKTLIWSVNSDIAKVDNNGNVTAIKEGEATIKVQSNDSKESTKPVQSSIKLEILPAKGKITFGDHGEEKKEINCKVGEKQGLIIRAEGWKNDNIATVKSYKSSDKSIVTIASHPNVAIDCINCAYTQIDCKKKGTATITATNSFGGKVTLKVVVKWYLYYIWTNKWKSYKDSIVKAIIVDDEFKNKKKNENNALFRHCFLIILQILTKNFKIILDCDTITIIRVK